MIAGQLPGGVSYQGREQQEHCQAEQGGGFQNRLLQEPEVQYQTEEQVEGRYVFALLVSWLLKSLLQLATGDENASLLVFICIFHIQVGVSFQIGKIPFEFKIADTTAEICCFHLPTNLL